MNAPTTTAEPSDNEQRAWWRLHLLTIVTFLLLVLSFVSLNLPLGHWADAHDSGVTWGGSFGWVGWPKPCYCIETEYGQGVVAKIAVTEIDFGSVVYNGVITVVLLLSGPAALEALTRKCSHLSRFNLATALTLMATIATYLGLRSGSAMGSVADKVVNAIQELAMLLVLVSIFICWFAVFHGAATRWGRRPRK